MRVLEAMADTARDAGPHPRPTPRTGGARGAGVPAGRTSRRGCWRTSGTSEQGDRGAQRRSSLNPCVEPEACHGEEDLDRAAVRRRAPHVPVHRSGSGDRVDGQHRIQRRPSSLATTFPVPKGSTPSSVGLRRQFEQARRRLTQRPVPAEDEDAIHLAGDLHRQLSDVAGALGASLQGAVPEGLEPRADGPCDLHRAASAGDRVVEHGVLQGLNRRGPSRAARHPPRARRSGPPSARRSPRTRPA